MNETIERTQVGAPDLRLYGEVLGEAQEPAHRHGVARQELEIIHEAKTGRLVAWRAEHQSTTSWEPAHTEVKTAHGPKELGEALGWTSLAKRAMRAAGFEDVTWTAAPEPDAPVPTSDAPDAWVDHLCAVFASRRWWEAKAVLGAHPPGVVEVDAERLARAIACSLEAAALDLASAVGMAEAAAAGKPSRSWADTRTMVRIARALRPFDEYQADRLDRIVDDSAVGMAEASGTGASA